MQLTSAHKIDTTATILIKKININAVLANDGFVAGISNELGVEEKKFHLVFTCYEKGDSYYMVVDFD